MNKQIPNEPTRGDIIQNEPIMENLTHNEPTRGDIIPDEPIMENLTHNEPTRGDIIPDEPVRENLILDEIIMDELVIEAKLENMGTVLGFINERIDDCSAKIQNQIRITVDEIFSNIARYAYHPRDGGAVVRIAVGDDVIIVFEDSGAPYDPLGKADPDISLSAEEREIGGLGLFMVKKLMDSVEYRREGNRNIMTIRKRLRLLVD